MVSLSNESKIFKPNSRFPRGNSALREALSQFVTATHTDSDSIANANVSSNANAEMFNLEEALRVNMEWFRDPLQKKPKDATDKTAVQQNVTNVEAIEVLKLSDMLGLNEMEALQIWTEAKDARTKQQLQEHRPLERAGAKSTLETALWLYYTQRGFLFQTISDLMRLRSVDDPAALAVAKQDFILRKTDEIVRQSGLISVLISAIRALNADISKLLSTSTRVEYLGKLNGFYTSSSIDETADGCLWYRYSSGELATRKAACGRGDFHLSLSQHGDLAGSDGSDQAVHGVVFPLGATSASREECTRVDSFFPCLLPLLARHCLRPRMGASSVRQRGHPDSRRNCAR